MNARGLEDRAAIIRAAWHEYTATWLTTMFGIGLGTFYATSAHTFGVPLIVHNTLVWTLTELGPLGLIMLFWLFGRCAVNLWKTRALAGVQGQMSQGIAAAMCSWACYSLFNEALYLRHLWLLLVAADRLYIFTCVHQSQRQPADNAA